MTIEQRMTKMEAAYGTRSELMKELREAVTVTAVIEARQGKVLKEHGKLIGDHSGVPAAPAGGVVAEMRALRARVKPDPEGWTTRDYVLHGGR